MGEVNVALGVWSANDSAILHLQVKVDTGSTYCQLPENVLRTLGWEPDVEPRRYLLADGSRGSARIGMVKIRLGDVDSMEWFVFGESNLIHLLGVETLQRLSLGVDPVNHRLMHISLDH